MKKILVISIVAISLIAAGFAFAQIVGSKHDMTLIATLSGGPCSACHHPHTGNNMSTNLLWNNNGWDDTAYDTYKNTSTKLTSTSAFESWACMSCHDGTFASGSLLRGTTNGTNLIATADLTDGTYELTNDHPVNVVMCVTDSANFFGNAGLAKLFGTNMVQCASCHDVHNQTSYNVMLYADLTGSAICTQCHNK